MDRPAPDPAKLLQVWMEWERGDALPGRTLSTLKTGGLRDILEELAAAQTSSPGAAEVSTDSWTPVV